jgi:hypothetical protein
MLIQEIITNAEDLAGGELIRAKLDRHYSTLIALNIIDTMMMELSLSEKALRDIKQSLTLVADTDTGTFDVSSFNLDSKTVRWRVNDNDPWNILDVVEDIEDLTRKFNAGKMAILFVGSRSPVTYYLSFKPAQDLTAEVWGKQIAAEITDLNDDPPFPPEFGMVAAYRIADFLLNHLLIIDPKNLQPFVIAQKASIASDKQRTEFIWTSYRVRYPDANNLSSPVDYNFLNDAVQDAEFNDEVIIEPGGIEVDLIEDP